MLILYKKEEKAFEQEDSLGMLQVQSCLSIKEMFTCHVNTLNFSVYLQLKVKNKTQSIYNEIMEANIKYQPARPPRKKSPRS